MDCLLFFQDFLFHQKQVSSSFAQFFLMVRHICMRKKYRLLVNVSLMMGVPNTYLT